MKTPIHALICFAFSIGASPLLADSKAEIALMKEVFAEIQPLSFKRNREYCGYIGYDFDGNLVASEARRGRKSSCRPRDPENIEVIIASYHTHGAYNGDEGSEVPSVEDMEGDQAEGIDGYVATPGGRFWYVDSEDMVISQICGVGCLDQDPDFEPHLGAGIEDSYTYDELVTWFNE